MLKALTIISVCVLLAAIVAGRSNPGHLFNVNPTLYIKGFTYLVFPYNAAFVKAKRIKTICYGFGNSSNKYCCQEFNKDGQEVAEFNLQFNNSTNKTDTIKREERIYNKTTGLLDTLIEFDDSNRPLFTKIVCYYYDDKNRLKEVLHFGFTEKNKPPYFKESQERDVVGIPMDSRANYEAPVNEYSINGRPVDPAALTIKRRNNDFYSLRYKYYQKGDFLVEQITNQYDFSKKYGGTDTCKDITSYYTANQKIVSEWRQYDCKEPPDLVKYYTYKDGMLDSIKDVISRPRDIAISYDAEKNFIGITDIWQGVVVSLLQIKYDKRGLATTLIRRSSTPDMSSYFMDDELFFSYTFY